MHRGAGHCFGYQHQFVCVQQGCGFWRQDQLGGLDRATQYAQPGISPRHQADGGTVAPDIVFTGTQKREMPVFEPAQKRDTFLPGGGAQG